LALERTEEGNAKTGRVVFVDAARGVAIVLMLFYHFFFDMDYFGICRIGIDSGAWLIFQRVIGTLFLLIAGISLVLSERHNKEGYLHHLKRGLFLGGVAILITVATWAYPHEGYIQFGIIHLIAISTIIAPLFFQFGKWNMAFGALVIVLGLWMGQLSIDTHALFWLGITDPGYTALDHYPLLPWFGIVLIGIALGQAVFAANKKIHGISSAPVSGIYYMYVVGPLAYLGRNSLTIYLIHQPIIIALIWLLLMR